MEDDGWHKRAKHWLQNNQEKNHGLLTELDGLSGTVLETLRGFG
jgi:hypothetical protein